MTDPKTTVVRLRTADDAGLVATAYAEPRLSWSLASTRPDAGQRAYEIQVSTDQSFTHAVSMTPVGALGSGSHHLVLDSSRTSRIVATAWPAANTP